MKDDDIKEIAAYFIIICEDLANERSQASMILPDKYAHIRDFTQNLIFHSYTRANDALEEGEIDQEQLSEIFWEYLYFFIHLTDRMACSALGDVARRTVIEELGTFAVLATLKAFNHQGTDSTFERHMAHLNSAVSEYSCFTKVVPAAGEGAKDTLLREFSKKINKIIGSETNPGALLGEQMVITQIAENLDIPTFVKAMSKTKAWWRFWD